MILGLSDAMEKGQKEKRLLGNQGQNTAKTINQFKKRFPSLSGSTRFIRQQVALLIPQPEWWSLSS
jgi:hypothetical protein